MVETVGKSLALVYLLPLMALGVFLLWLSLYSLWAYLFGGKTDDPYQWPEVEGVVKAHQSEAEFRGNRVPVPFSSGPQVETVNVKVTVQLADGTLADVSPPELWQMRITQPAGMSFSEFMQEIDQLALAEARQRLPVGSSLKVAAYLGQGVSSQGVYRGSDGSHWRSAFSKKTNGSKPLAILVMLFILCFGIGITAYALLMLRVIFGE